MVATGARASKLSMLLSEQGFTPSARKPAAPRLPDLLEDAAARILSTYRSLGGVLELPALRPGSWDLAFTNGLVIELDEELHFNRFRQLTLGDDLPWSSDYSGYEGRESECLSAGRWGRRWTSPPAERMFGPADPPGVLGELGSPRWKQRALYDAMKDAALNVPLARLSVHDLIGDVTLGDVLSHGSRFDPRALVALVEQRTT